MIHAQIVLPTIKSIKTSENLQSCICISLSFGAPIVGFNAQVENNTPVLY